jgi:DNA-binding transcriptional LysR family regulator
MDTIDGMRVFAAVVEARSFSAAARTLGISTALASKYVGQLEERLGARLLNRTTRKSSPTEVGSAYYERCTKIISEFDELEQAVNDQHAAPRGVLRVSGPRAFGEDGLVPAVASFMTRYPAITVELLLEERMVDIVAEGFDLAIRVGALEDSSMIARRITDFPYYVCASPDYLAAAGMPETPADLSDHQCVVNTAISPTGQWRFMIDGQERQVTVPARARVNTAPSTATLVRAGLGLGVCLISTVRDDLEAGRLVRVLQSFDAYDRSIYAMYPHARHLSGKVRVFVDHLLDSFQSHRYDGSSSSPGDRGKI